MSALFDDVSRILAGPSSRRQAFRLVGGALGGAVIASLGLGRASLGWGAPVGNSQASDSGVTCPTGQKHCGGLPGICCGSTQFCCGSGSNIKCCNKKCCTSPFGGGTVCCDKGPFCCYPFIGPPVCCPSGSRGCMFPGVCY